MGRPDETLPRSESAKKRFRQEQLVLNWVIGMIERAVDPARVYPEILDALKTINLVDFAKEFGASPTQATLIFQMLGTKGLVVSTNGTVATIDPVGSDLTRLKDYENELFHLFNARPSDTITYTESDNPKGVYVHRGLRIDSRRGKQTIEYESGMPRKYYEGNNSINLLIDLMDSPSKSVYENDLLDKRVPKLYRQFKRCPKGSDKYVHKKEALDNRLKSYMRSTRKLLAKIGAPPDFLSRDHKVIKLAQ